MEEEVDMRELYNDSLEHEIKFKLKRNVEFQKAFEIMNKHFSLVEEGVDYVTDYYYDTEDFFLLKKHMSYRIRIRDGSKRFRINFKFPDERNEYPIFVRREILSKIKMKYLNYDNPLDIACIVNENVKGLLKLEGRSDDLVLVPSLVIKTMRIRYWVTKRRKDIEGKFEIKKATGFSYAHDDIYNKAKLKPNEKNEIRALCGYFGQGLVCFDSSLFYSPQKLLLTDIMQQFEFELWNGALCDDLFIALQNVGQELSKAGLERCINSKYEEFLNCLNDKVEECGYEIGNRKDF